MKRIALMALIFFIMAGVCYAQTLEELKAEKERIALGLQQYRLSAQDVIRKAEVRLIQIDAVIADRENQAKQLKEALEQKEAQYKSEAEAKAKQAEEIKAEEE